MDTCYYNYILCTHVKIIVPLKHFVGIAKFECSYTRVHFIIVYNDESLLISSGTLNFLCFDNGILDRIELK